MDGLNLAILELNPGVGNPENGGERVLSLAFADLGLAGERA
jgi:hypothetical protein